MSFRHPVSIVCLREGPNRYPNCPSHLSGNQHLATHVAALLSARLLVLHPASGSWAKCHWDVLKAKGGLGTMIPASSLNVDASGAVLNEHLGELHSGGDASMASVCICDDGIQVVLIAIRVGSKKNCTELMYSKPSVSHTNDHKCITRTSSKHNSKMLLRGNYANYAIQASTTGVLARSSGFMRRRSSYCLRSWKSWARKS